jgi:predicted dehydrogenase
LLEEGAVGRLVHLNHTEHIGHWHFAHSFVRGNWRDERESSPMVLAKASHDLDLLRWIAGSPARHVSAYGALHHFRAEHAPPGAPDRCLDGCPAEPTCPYSARRIYLDRFGGQDGWPNNVVTPDPTPERLLAALRDGPYGRCVYRCDNTVLDTYSINILFENDVTAAFTLTAFTEQTTRTLHAVGTHGELYGHFDRAEIVVEDFRTHERRTIPVPGDAQGHGGGDEALTLDFIDLLERYRGGEAATSLTAFEECLDAHLMAFDAHRDAVRHQHLGGRP